VNSDFLVINRFSLTLPVLLNGSFLAAGFVEVKSFNPYWDKLGRTFEDHDGYRVVLQRAAWSNGEFL